MFLMPKSDKLSSICTLKGGDSRGSLRIGNSVAGKARLIGFVGVNGDDVGVSMHGAAKNERKRY